MAENMNFNGFDFRFEMHGQGIPLVYTPGAMFPLDTARPVAEKLAPLGYSVLLWDRPNTGGSGLVFEGDDLYRIWADKLRDLLHYLGHHPTFLAGRTAGYFVPLVYAYHYPGEVRGLILISAVPDDLAWWEAFMRPNFLEVAEVAEREGMAAAIEAVLAFPLFNWHDQFERAPQKRGQLLAMDPAVFATRLRAWYRSIMREHRGCAGLSDEQLATLNIPAIVLSGVEEWYARSQAETLYERLPQSELVISAEYDADSASLVSRVDEFVRSVV